MVIKMPTLVITSYSIHYTKLYDILATKNNNSINGILAAMGIKDLKRDLPLKNNLRELRGTVALCEKENFKRIKK